jgi:hypothetical protein
MDNIEYNPENSPYYNYGVKFILTQDINNINNAAEYQNIYLCVYNVNIHGKYPFLQYLLTDAGYNVLSFPKLSKYTLFNNESLVPYSKVYLSGILQRSNFDNFKNEIEFNGFYEYEYDLYLFFDVTKCNYFIDEIYISNPIRFALIDEILNQKSVCNIPIDENTVYFAVNNKTICNLYDKNNEAYELPIVGYIGKPTESKMKFVSMFGESAKDKMAILGPHFYFTSLKNAIRQCLNDDCNKGGIVRFALFTGSTKYIENLPNAPNDASIIKHDRLNDKTMDTKIEVLTMRISDHDGIWSNTYKSAYLNDIELDDGSFLPDTPMLVLKEYNQQLPLTYHYIDKSTIAPNKECSLL